MTDADTQRPRVLFIDRDGTLIVEPPVDFQVDSLEKLELMPGALRAMHFIASRLPFELVMVTNQDGLGTELFPEDTFWPAHNKMLKAFANEGVTFDDIIIDRTLPEDNAPTRKPGTALLGKYMSGDYDLSGSRVIGDRLTDVMLARNLGCKAILLREPTPELMKEIADAGLSDAVERVTPSWDDVTVTLQGGTRRASVSRVTSESKIEITVEGDLHVDEHHTVEDTAIALGEALRKALGDKRGIERYGFVLPMDDCLCTVAVDFGGRPWLVWDAQFKRERIGDMPTEMFMHFFKSLSDNALMNLFIRAEGINEHHKIEGIFKGLARALRQAIKRDPLHFTLPSTKGTL